MDYFVSYSQNLEDVLLWRALRNVSKGFYIDVGGWDPVEDSVTKGFYDRGWSGINIEPVPKHAAKFAETRPRDVNLMVAVADHEGVGFLHEIGDTGLSTLNKEEALRHSCSGRTSIIQEVTTTTLARICSQNVKGPVHFLKVDVEGGELGVLKGMDFQFCRPWIILVEATKPGSPEESFSDWEPILLENSYRFAYFDGLNRYYIASEKFGELQPSFRCPPNPFDNFARYTEMVYREDGMRKAYEIEQLRISEQRLQEALEAKGREAKIFESGLLRIDKELDASREKLRISKLRSEELKLRLRDAADANRRLIMKIQYHQATPLRALQLWWNRKKAGDG